MQQQFCASLAQSADLQSTLEIELLTPLREFESFYVVCSFRTQSWFIDRHPQSILQHLFLFIQAIERLVVNINRRNVLQGRACNIVFIPPVVNDMIEATVPLRDQWRLTQLQMCALTLNKINK